KTALHAPAGRRRVSDSANAPLDERRGDCANDGAGNAVMDVIVIGGGVNGLVAAALLAKHKLEVTILERQPVVGGSAATSELAPGFHVPALSHALGPVHRDVVRALQLDRGAGLEFLTPDPALTTLGANGDVVSFHRDAVLTAGSINAVSARDAATWR